MKNLKYFLIIVILFNAKLAFSISSFELGNREFLKEDYEQAIIYFEKAIQEEKDVRAWYNLGLSYLRLGLNHLSHAISLKSVYEKADKDFNDAKSSVDKEKVKQLNEIYEKAKDEFSKLKDHLAAAEYNLLKAKESLGIGLQKANNSVEQNKYLQNLRETTNALDELESIENKISDNTLKSNMYLIIILGIIAFSSLAVIGYILYANKKRKAMRNYKEQTINNDLTSSLSLLNEEFVKARAVIYHSKNQKAIENIEEIEDRCIALNDKLEELRYGLRNVDEETFKDEVDFTREMVNECLHRLEKSEMLS